MTDSKASTLMRVEDRVAQDAGIVDDAVEPAEMCRSRVLTILLAGIASATRLEVGDRRAAALLDLLDHFLGGRGARSGAVGGAAGIVDHDLGAFGGAEQRDLAADAAAGAGDDDDFVLQ